ncbi:CaiB/BaiF CoA transferase family protein [Thermoactinomyces mirandus]|uniref:CoA transferase n=1 Tax=Thermoactinomyces mirandus TaxID=2756294 RepID=A0A7W1XS27_9BACL|nr:CoA transferase [Thermoactinomyces mirandus]MBA4602249.1 CoA transferase [Thermoactinomyces mirandus]
MKRDGPLTGIQVLDLSRVLAGPFCTMILGDLGADVIKVEAPGQGDETRGWGPPWAGETSAYYLSVNRNKRSMVLNLKTEQGQAILLDLVRHADILVENFKVGTLAKFGLPPKRLLEINPRLIVAEISGFGQNGPFSHKAGYDYMIQALSGLMSITGSPESGPMKVGVAIVDVLTGLFTATGILAALHERNSSGKGQILDVALFDASVASLVNVASNYLISGKVPQLLGNAHPNIAPYQLFQTRDQPIIIAVGNDTQFRRLAECLGCPWLAEDPRFAKNSARVVNRKALVQKLETILTKHTSSHWISLFEELNLPSAPIQTLDQVFSRSQVKERNLLVEMEHPTAGNISLVGSPLNFSRTPVSYRKYPPLLGEHTEEILREMGYSRMQVKEWEQAKVFSPNEKRSE